METIQNEIGLETEEAARTATKAALSTTGEQLTGEAKQKMASDLPGEFVDTVEQSGDGEGKQMDSNEFVSRIQNRESTKQQRSRSSDTEHQPDPSNADEHLDGVAKAIGSAVGAKAASEIQKQLPERSANALKSANTGDSS